jgi:hypothetical protein
VSSLDPIESTEEPERAAPLPDLPAPRRVRRRRRDDVCATLRSRSSLRRGVLLRAVLGPPVALRDPSGDRPW